AEFSLAAEFIASLRATGAAADRFAWCCTFWDDFDDSAGAGARDSTSAFDDSADAGARDSASAFDDSVGAGARDSASAFALVAFAAATGGGDADRVCSACATGACAAVTAGAGCGGGWFVVAAVAPLFG